MYQPKPLDTSNVQLTEELNELLEMLAFNTHEVWSAQRIKDGWSYGEQRDDDKKQHPGLVEYDQLTETEKDYDRNTSREALKMIIAAGFNIEKVK